MSNKTKKLLLLNLPYFIAGLVCTNLGEAWRIAEGADMSEKLLGFLSALGAAFSNPGSKSHCLQIPDLQTVRCLSAYPNEQNRTPCHGDISWHFCLSDTQPMWSLTRKAIS